MKLQTKFLIIIIPFALLSLLALGLWSFNEAKTSVYESNYRYMRIVLESYTVETLHKNHQLLKDAKMDQVVSYLESYKINAINKAKILTTTRGGSILIFNGAGKLVSSTQEFNSVNVELLWKEISKKITTENATDIIAGYIDQKHYNGIYVSQYFKPWDWVLLYSIPDDNISASVNKIRLITFGIIILCAIVSTLMIFLFFNRFLLTPIAKLKDAALSIAAQEDIKTISIHSKDELGLLARSMEAMSSSINLYKSEQKKTEQALIEKHEELQKKQSELRLHQNSLEQLVDERTVELKRSEKKFKTIVEKSPLPMVITDENQDILLFNDKFTELFGYTLEDVSIAEKWWEIAYPDETYRAEVQQSWIVAIEKAKVNKTDIEMQEWELTIKDSSKRSCEFYMVPLEAASLIVVNDITERKKNEEDLNRQASAMDNSSDTIVITDTSGTINYVNPAFEKISGYKVKEVLGKDLSILKSGVHNTLFYKKLWDTITQGDTWSGQFTNKRKDGSAYTEEATISPIFSKAGKIINYVAVKRDITDRLKLETKLRQAQKMESIGTLAGGIAHDFNNILSSIIGFTELALGGTENGSELEDDLQEVLIAGMRAKELVKQILTFARQSDETVKPIQVNAIVKEVLKFIQSSIPSTIKISEKINSDSFIMGSSTQIHQVMMNLCTNAAHAMEQRGGILEVSLSDTTINSRRMLDLIPGDYIELKVADTGVGIPSQHIQNIFDPYFTDKPVGEGTGLGLAVVHGIIEGYAGRIAVESKVGKGTVFSIYLPITKKRKIYTNSENIDLPTGNERILFVDDEAPIAKMGKKLLEQIGYSVTARTSSVEALELFRTKPDAFDLVVTDMTMPNMTGDELTLELIKIRSDIPVVLCTGYSKRITEESASEIGIKAFAYKPIVKTDLARKIRKVLDETNCFE